MNPNDINLNPQMVKDYAAKWRVEGVAIIIDDIHMRFAHDFATAMVRLFVTEQLQAQQQAAAQAAKPKIILEG